MLRTLVLTGFLILIGCSTRGDLYWGWQCDGAANTPDWNCEQRLLRDGQPVDETELDPADIPPRPATEPRSSVPDDGSAITPKTSAIATDTPASDWRQQLPNLDGSLSVPPRQAEPYINPLETSGRSADNVSGPVPEPEPYRLPRQKAHQEAAPEPVKAPKPAANSAVTTVPATKTYTANNKGYTLQLTALSTEQEISRFISRFQLDDLSLVRTYIESRGKRWHVLTTGTFADRAAAERAGEELASAYPGLACWVRSLQSLQAASID